MRGFLWWFVKDELEPHNMIGGKAAGEGKSCSQVELLQAQMLYLENS